MKFKPGDTITERDVSEIVKKYWMSEVEKDCLTTPILVSMLPPQKPLTRWQKLIRFVSMYWDRVCNAYSALKGEYYE